MKLGNRPDATSVRAVIHCNNELIMANKKRQVVVGLILLLLMAKFGSAQQLAVTPAYVELNLKEKGAGTLIITNVTNENLRCRAQVTHWRMATAGQIEMVPIDKHSLAPWIKFNPKEFTLAPKSSQYVRYSVIPTARLEVGEYWGGVHFEPLVEQNHELGSGKGVTASVKVVTTVLVPFFGQYGDFDFSARMDTLRAVVTEKGVVIKSTVVNTGRSGLRLGGDYDIIDPLGKVAATGKLPLGFILPEGVLEMSTLYAEALPQGRYTAKVRCLDRKTNQLLVSGETKFEVGIGH